MQILADLLNTIPAIDPTAMSRAQRHIDGLLKPVGSGKAGGACHTTGRNAGVEWHTAWAKKRYWLCVPITASGRKGSLFLKEVTIQAENMTRGTTGVCVLAAQAGANVHVIDVGIDTAEPIPGLSTCVSHEVAAILLQLRQ